MKDVHGFLELVYETKPECTEVTPDYFYADPNDEEEKYGRSERAIAVSVCRRCPIQYECMMHAITNGIEEGVWGGRIPQERASYARRMKGTA